MTRRVSVVLLLAVLATACGAPRAETPDFSDDLGAIVEARSTTTTVEPTPVAESEAVTTTLPPGVQFADSLPIEKPTDFPTVTELGLLIADGAFPHQRAKITSRLSLTGGFDELAARGVDVDKLDLRMTITYFDGVIIWDDPDGFRQVYVPNVGSMVQGADGSWQLATGDEWTVVGPLSNWGSAQDEAEAVMSGEAQVVGYEMVADTPTIRLLFVNGSNREHLWLDERGAALRIVADFTGPDGTSEWVGVWSVETLAPVLTGPLPEL